MVRSIRMIASLSAALVLIATLVAADKPAVVNLLKPAGDVKNWRFEQHEEAKGNLVAADGAVVLEVTKDDGTDWHVQAFQTAVNLKDATEYVVTFKAKSDVERVAKVQAAIDVDDWHVVGLDEEVSLTKEWKDYEYKFTASETKAMMNRVGFVVGMAKGKVYVKDLVLKTAK